jgi:hypothetical protein
VESPVEHGRDFRLEFLAKLYFATQASASTVRDLLSMQRQACVRWIAELHAQLDTSDPDKPFERLIFAFRLTQSEAILRWLDTCEQTLT